MIIMKFLIHTKFSYIKAHKCNVNAVQLTADFYQTYSNAQKFGDPSTSNYVTPYFKHLYLYQPNYFTITSISRCKLLNI